MDRLMVYTFFKSLGRKPFSGFIQSHFNLNWGFFGSWLGEEVFY